MTPASVDLTIYKGSTFSRQVQWKTGTPALPVNITGCTLRMQIRGKITDASVILSLTTENGGIVITDAVNGKFSVVIEASASTAVAATSGVYDLEIVMPDTTTVYRLMEGSVTLVPEVTRV